MTNSRTLWFFRYYGPFGRPILVIRNLDMIRKIVVKDFDHFTDRNMNQDNVNPKANKHFASGMTGNIDLLIWKCI